MASPVKKYTRPYSPCASSYICTSSLILLRNRCTPSCTSSVLLRRRTYPFFRYGRRPKKHEGERQGNVLLQEIADRGDTGEIRFLALSICTKKGTLVAPLATALADPHRPQGGARRAWTQTPANRQGQITASSRNIRAYPYPLDYAILSSGPVCLRPASPSPRRGPGSPGSRASGPGRGWPPPTGGIPLIYSSAYAAHVVQRGPSTPFHLSRLTLEAR